MFKKFPIPPGVDRQGTKNSIGARWYESQNMRFRDDYPESIGGWEEESSYGMNGIPRGIHTWTDFNDNQYICVGTTFKFYILIGPNKYDITPNRESSTTLGANPLDVTSGSTVITVNDTSHGCSVNDFVYFESISDSDLDGLSATVLTGEPEGFQIFDVVDDDSYKIDVSSSDLYDGDLPTGTSSQGGTVVISYRVKSGTLANQTGSGYGVGDYGGDDFIPTEYSCTGSTPITTNLGTATINVDISSSGATVAANDYIYLYGLTGTAGDLNTEYLNNKWWKVSSIGGGNANFIYHAIETTGGSSGGSSGKFYWDDIDNGGVVGASRGWGDASTASVLTDSLRHVTIQNFGEDLIFCNSGGPLFYYDTSTNTSSGTPEAGTRAIEITSSTPSGATEPPTIVDFFLVSEQHGHVIAFATNDIGASEQNAMLVRWSDRHNPFAWLPTNSNEAGGRVLRHGSRIIGAVQTKREIIVFTNKAIYSCRYTGSPDTYGFETISRNTTAYSRGSFAAVDNVVFFMGLDQFYMYDGSVRPLPKNLANYVFDDINEGQKDKCFTGVNSSFTEVYWFYPSSDSFEPNRWVSYNYSNQTWAYGSFDMTALSSSNGGQTSYCRTAWEDVNIFDSPIAPYVTNYEPDSLPQVQKSSLMKHESGRSANGSAINHYIESGQIDVSEGEMYMHYSRILPDVDIFDQSSDTSSHQVTLTIAGKNLPGRSEHSQSSVTVDFSDNSTSGLNYEPDYNATSIRGRGRTISFRAESNSSGFGWRLGTLRLDLKPDGRRG